MSHKIAITNRKLCSDLCTQLKILNASDYDLIILREKDLNSEEYTLLAKKALEISPKVILHTYISACESLDYYKIHLPFEAFEKNADRLKDYILKGVSIHSLSEAKRAEELGADYITASHIFSTDCKADLEPRGLKWLEEICNSVSIPVYALGGINSENAQDCIKAGAKGICMMSEAMKITERPVP